MRERTKADENQSAANQGSTGEGSTDSRLRSPIQTGCAIVNVYEIITDRIIKQLESGVAPWRKPWSAKLPVNLISQKPYRGLNVLTLASQGYPSRFWLTFNQANRLGGRIRKGEKSSPVIYWNIREERRNTNPK